MEENIANSAVPAQPMSGRVEIKDKDLKIYVTIHRYMFDGHMYQHHKYQSYNYGVYGGVDSGTVHDPDCPCRKKRHQN